jgi:hypothetical protein
VIKYTTDEIKRLEKSQFIRKVKYKKEIEYEPVFELWTVYMRLLKPEMSSKMIFQTAGIDTSILNPDLPRRNIHLWLDKYVNYGIKYFTDKMEYILLEDTFNYELAKSLINIMPSFNSKVNEMRRRKYNGKNPYCNYI